MKMNLDAVPRERVEVRSAFPAFAIFSALAFLALICLGCAKSREITEFAPTPGRGFIFVSTNGNDAWSGLISAPNRTGTDGPVATIPRALAVARQLRSAGATDVQTILVRGGTYWLNNPIILKPEDSNLRIAAASGEVVVISGGRPIREWNDSVVGSRKYWVAEVSAARTAKWFFRELWVNGERRIRARHPDKNYLKIEALLDNTGNWQNGHTRFRFHTNDIPMWADATNGEVIAMTRWVESRLPITSIDETQRVISFGKRSVFELQPGDPYYIEHTFEALDSPGEWFLNAAEGRLYYMPLPGEQIVGFEAIAPVHSQLLRFEGRPETGEFVHDVELRGLTFSHTEWNLAPVGATNAPPGWPAPTSEVGGFAQAAIGVPAAVWGEGVRNCAIVACRFENLGTYALELARGCQSNLISRCVFDDLGAGGVRIGETTIRASANERTSGNEISDCEIANGGRVFHSAIGVWIGQSFNNRVIHNLIHDFYYTGISVGWTWGYGPSLAAGNLIEFNHVHHIGVQSNGDGPILSDMGGIYTLGIQPGTRIANNLWHDISASRYGGWGIYFDEGSSGVIAESNLVYRTTHGGFHQHYGATNIVRNNVFAYGRDQQIQRTRPESHLSFFFTNNIIVFDHGALLAGSWADDQFVMDNNLYWNSRPDFDANNLRFAGATFEQWRARGHDTNSMIADPIVMPSAINEFKLKSDSPALRLGFQPIHLTRVGPR